MSNRNRKRKNRRINEETGPGTVIEVFETDDSGSGPDTGEEQETVNDPESEQETASGHEAEPEAEAEAEPEAESEPESEAESEAKPDPEPEPESEAEPETEPEPEQTQAGDPEGDSDDPDIKDAKKQIERQVEEINIAPEDEVKISRHATRKYNILFVSEGARHVHTIRTSADVILLVTILAVALIAAFVAYIIHGATVRDEYESRISTMQEEITTLSEDNILLQADIETLDHELREANSKLSEKDNLTQAKTEEQALLYMPSALPLDSQALPSEYDKKNKWITIDAAPGVHVVATGDGTVSYAGESVEAGGYLVSVDHGNGYESDYYCQSPPVVKDGAQVQRGTSLFVIGDEADKLIYRIKYEDDFIDPYTVLNIAG